jgi:hypothetical protein
MSKRKVLTKKAKIQLNNYIENIAKYSKIYQTKNIAKYTKQRI